MDLKYASDSDLEIFSKTFEKLNIHRTCSYKFFDKICHFYPYYSYYDSNT